MIRATLFMAALVTSLAPDAHGSSMDYCRPYARDLTQVLIKYIWMRAYASCVNSEDDPRVPDNWQSAWFLVDPIGENIDPEGVLKKKRKLAVTPATAGRLDKVASLPPLDKVASLPPDPLPADPPADPPPSKSKTKMAQVSGSGGNPQAVCIKAGMRTVYKSNGHSWRCKK